MKTKDLVPGKQYAVRYGQNYRPTKAICLSTTDRFTRMARGTARPAVPEVGERGGLPFAAQSYNGTWVPIVVQPGAVFAEADDFDKAQNELRDKQEAEYQARHARAVEQARIANEERQAKREAFDKLCADLAARGLPDVVRYDEWNGRVIVDEAFLQQVVRRLKVKVSA